MSHFNPLKRRRLRLENKKRRSMSFGQRVNQVSKADRETAAIEGLVVNRRWKKAQKKAKIKTRIEEP